MHTKNKLSEKCYCKNYKIAVQKYRFLIMRTAVFLADIGYLVKQLSNHYTTLCPKNLEKLSNFDDCTCLKIASSKSMKLIGLRSDNKLTSDIHINNLCKSKSNYVKIKGLKRIQNRLNISLIRMAYDSFFLSQLKYCSMIWMFCNKNLQNTISRIQNCAHKYFQLSLL